VVEEEAQYPPSIRKRAASCRSMAMHEAVEMGTKSFLTHATAPVLLTNASEGWGLLDWSDELLREQVGEAPIRMLLMPADVHPTIDEERKALVEPSASNVFFTDYLRLLDRLATTEEFAVYVAQLNLLRLPALLAKVCLPTALPAERLSMVNLWVGGHSMKNGLHFDNYDNLLHQISGRKKALIFPPQDTPHLYYGPTPIRRHSFSLEAGFTNDTVHETTRQNVALINVFDERVEHNHPTVTQATPTVCDLDEGDALFLPKGWHHAVISSAQNARNIAVNLWFDLDGNPEAKRQSSLSDMFQATGC